MKKYLNKNIFFQGDGNIVLMLTSLFISLWALLEFTVKNSYQAEYRMIVYDYSYYGENLSNGYLSTPLGEVISIILLVFLLLSFILICGMFKRKKWSTLLSCSFSRIDIRKRELTLMCGCIVGFISIFLIVYIRYAIENSILISYINNFWSLVGMDIIRIIIISLVVTSVLFFIDSLTSNMYVTLATIFSSGLYFVAIIMTIGNCFLWSYNYSLMSVRYFIGDIIESILVGSKNTVYSYKFLIAIIILLVITFICVLTTKNLTKKIKIEHMGDAFIFIPIRKMIPFLLSTLIGMSIGTIIFQNLVWNSEFELSLNSVSYPIVSLGIISIVSIIANIIIKFSIKAIKNKIPKKYI